MAYLNEYRGYKGTAFYNTAEDKWYGGILHIPVIISYSADDMEKLQVAFELAVDNYRIVTARI